MPQELHNRDSLKLLRKELRKNATVAEKALWDILKSAKLDGRKFRRQHSVGNYILDFYCPAEQLSIELDGEGHFTTEGKAYDAVRTAYLASCNIREIRFENQLVVLEPDVVIERIRAFFRG